MEEKKLDSKTIIGFVLIFLLLLWVAYNNRPATPETAEKKEVEKKESTQVVTEDKPQSQKTEKDWGVFSSAMNTVFNQVVTLENDKVRVKINSKGGQILEVLLKSFDTYQPGESVYLVKDGNSDFSLEFFTSDNRLFDTKEMNFEPRFFETGGTKGVSMRLKISENQFLEYVYELPKDSYMLNFTARSQGWSSVLRSSKPVTMRWAMKQRRMDKSIDYENRYSQLAFQYSGKEVSKLSVSGEEHRTEYQVNWLAFKQHLFTSILIAETPLESVEMYSNNLVKASNGEFTKFYEAKAPLTLKQGEISEAIKLYYGPSDYHLLKSYKKYDLTDIIPFGWGIFGMLNRWVFLPLFDFLNHFLSVGIAIILMTVIVRLVLSPIAYKSYISQAKMKVLRPEINEINENFKDPMKRQQETMSLYRKAGVNPMSGCLPALLQLPIFLALFNFFPNVFELRQAPFLWASDLSSYDSVLELPFSIPFYGSHVSLFPILASAAIFVYTMMTMSQQTQTQQPGMPNMKFLMYLSPVMMLFFFNNYASGLSLYYFISNLITIFIMLVIKYWIIDENKIHAQIQENKKKPKKEGRFQRKMREMMEQAEAQQKAQRR